MYRVNPKISGINKAILFTEVGFVFLFIGLNASAASCDKSGWNRANCDVTIDYTDPCPNGICS